MESDGAESAGMTPDGQERKICGSLSNTDQPEPAGIGRNGLIRLENRSARPSAALAFGGGLAQELAELAFEGRQLVRLPADREPVVELEGELDAVRAGDRALREARHGADRAMRRQQLAEQLAGAL
jgi:hypothetical protein